MNSMKRQNYMTLEDKHPQVIRCPICYQGSSVQLLSCIWLFATPWTAACQASLSITNSWSLLKLMSIESMMSSNDLVLCHSVLLHLQSFSASGSFPTSQFFKHQMAKPEKSRGQLLTAPERMKLLGQSRNGAQL